MSRACSQGLQASAGFPVCTSKTPMVWWLVARSLWNAVTAGLASASFCQMSRALRDAASASVGFPVCASRTPMLLWLRPGRSGTR